MSLFADAPVGTLCESLKSWKDILINHSLSLEVIFFDDIFNCHSTSIAALVHMAEPTTGDIL